jgi:hypothetical protein
MLDSTEPDPSVIPGFEYDTDITTGFLDLRSYNRVGPGSFLNLRGVLGGSLNDRSLPPQFQHAMGGVGSLPAYALFSIDCGARSGDPRYFDVNTEGVTVREPVFPSYGCDRIALFQAEFRGSLFVDWDLGRRGGDVWDDDWSWAPRFELSPDWTAFFNMGRGWTADGLGDTDTLMDVGVGLYLGDLGVFYAYPIKEEPGGGRSGNFFIRLSRRF